MQMAVIETMRNVLNIKNANTTELDENCEAVVGLMTEWDKDGAKEIRHKDGDLGGTMRLGAYECKLETNSLAYRVYGKEIISERHRHRYEVNNEYRKQIADKGLVFSGLSPDGMLCEIVELPQNDWFVACQFHPEFKSRPDEPAPLFVGLIEAAKK